MSRRALLCTVRGARTGGADLGAEQAPEAADVGRAVFRSVLEQAALTGFSPSAAEEPDQADWPAVDTPSPGPAD